MRGEGKVLLVLRGKLLLLLLVLNVVKRCDRGGISRLHRCRGWRGDQALKQGRGRRSGCRSRSRRGRRLVEMQGVGLLVGRGRPRRVSGVARARGRDQGEGRGRATSILPLLLFHFGWLLSLLLHFVNIVAPDWLLLLKIVR